MATTPTTNPIPSESPRDLKFNAGKVDEFVNSYSVYYTDRFGNQRRTLEGIRQTASQAASLFGYITLDSFEDGATLTVGNQVLRYEATGEYYRWDGPFPKTVAPGSTPSSSGGVGSGAWISVGDASLRSNLASSTGATLVGFSASLTVAQRLTQMATFMPILKDNGAAGNGTTNDASALFALSGNYIATPGVYYINTSGTINAKIHMMDGAKFLVGTGVILTFAQAVNANDEQKIFKYASLSTSRINLNVNSRVSLGWFDHALDGTEDWSAIMNHIIAASGVFGREIYCGPGRRLLNNPVNLQDKNYITIYGNGKGIRSNIEYEKAPPAGNGAVTTYPGGSAQFSIGVNNTIAFSLPATSTTNYRSSGNVIKGLTISGHNSPSVTQYGISIQSDNDGYTISDNCIINVRGFGINIKGNDALDMHGNWIAECRSPLFMNGGKESKVENNIFGGMPTGITCDIQDQIRLNFTGNNLAPDGYTALNLLNVRNGVFSGNIITGRFAGLVTMFTSNLNIFSGNTFRVPNDEVTDWTTGKGAWASTNYDPQNRDILYGVIYLSGSNDNIFSDCTLQAYVSGTNPVVIRLKSPSLNNIFSNIRLVMASASTQAITIEAGSNNNQFMNASRSTEVANSGTNTQFIAYRT